MMQIVMSQVIEDIANQSPSKNHTSTVEIQGQKMGNRKIDDEGDNGSWYWREDKS